MSQPGIFISHSSVDHVFCNHLTEVLQDAGADAWSHEHAAAIGGLEAIIRVALEAHPIFIVLLSPAAFSSEWVKKECEIARDTSRLIVPVTVQPLTASVFQGSWQFLDPLRRIEAAGYQPYPENERIDRILDTLHLQSPKHLLAEGRDYNANGEFDRAIPVLEHASALRPQDFDVWDNLAWAYNERRRHADALAAGLRATLLNPRHGGAWNSTAWALNGLELYQAGLVASERALALDDKAYIWNTKGWALRGLGRTVEALAAFDTAIQRDPNWPWAKYEKAKLLRALGREDEAEGTERNGTDE